MRARATGPDPRDRARDARAAVDAIAARARREVIGLCAAARIIDLRGQPAGMPRVSVVIPCYKQAQYLAEAIDSVLAQGEEAQIIVVNDGSPDDTSAVAGRYGRRVILIEQDNRGLAAARNRGLAEATGDLLLPLDADDRLKPRYFDALRRALEPAAKTWFAPAFDMFGFVNGVKRPAPDITLAQLLLRNPFHPASAFSRRMQTEVGDYDPQMRGGWEDWDYWIRAYALGWRPVGSSEPLIDYRTRPDSMAMQTRDMHGDLVRRLVAKHHALYVEALPSLVLVARQGTQQAGFRFESRDGLREFWRETVRLPSRALRYARRRLSRGIYA